MPERVTGRYIETSTGGEKVRAFVPLPLPPDPSIDLSDENISLLLPKAIQSLSNLKIASKLVPSRDWFIYSFLRMEAILSSQIEGTQATLTDLFAFEARNEIYPEDPDLQEVCNYLSALEYAKKELKREKGLPLSLRLLKEMHKRLMKGVRGSSKHPGEFRTSQNWIGGPRPSLAHFVPPPPSELKDCLHDFEKFLHADTDLSPLIKIAVLHLQFETIHPFLDGNGRLGRLLISLLLEDYGFLDARLLYLSLFLKRNQKDYYERLDGVRLKGDWESWISFFLEGVCTICDEAVKTAELIFEVFENDRKRLLANKHTNVVALQLLEILPEHPTVTVNRIGDLLKITKPTAMKAISILERISILKQVGGAERHRIFSYKKYIDILRGVEERSRI